MQAENRREARALAGSGDAGAMQCDARRLGTYARSDWRRAGVPGCSSSGGGVVVCSGGRVDGRMCVCVHNSGRVGADGWRGEGGRGCR